MQNNYLYFLNSKPYINLTNICTNSCVFCVRDIKDDVRGSNMWLEGKLRARDVIAQFTKSAVDKIEAAGEITFCGYGEPLLCPDVLIEVAKFIKQNFQSVKIRINTNGCASYALKRDILPELRGLIDTISISLNAHDEETYNLISKPHLEGSYQAMLDFMAQSAALEFDTIATIVVGFDDKIYIDVDKCREIAQNNKAKFRIREWIKEGY